MPCLSSMQTGSPSVDLLLQHTDALFNDLIYLDTFLAAYRATDSKTLKNAGCPVWQQMNHKFKLVFEEFTQHADAVCDLASGSSTAHTSNAAGTGLSSSTKRPPEPKQDSDWQQQYPQPAESRRPGHASVPSSTASPGRADSRWFMQLQRPISTLGHPASTTLPGAGMEQTKQGHAGSSSRAYGAASTADPTAAPDVAVSATRRGTSMKAAAHQHPNANSSAALAATAAAAAAAASGPKRVRFEACAGQGHAAPNSTEKQDNNGGAAGARHLPIPARSTQRAGLHEAQQSLLHHQPGNSSLKPAAPDRSMRPHRTQGGMRMQGYQPSDLQQQDAAQTPNQLRPGRSSLPPSHLSQHSRHGTQLARPGPHPHEEQRGSTRANHTSRAPASPSAAPRHQHQQHHSSSSSVSSRNPLVQTPSQPVQDLSYTLNINMDGDMFDIVCAGVQPLLHQVLRDVHTITHAAQQSIHVAVESVRHTSSMHIQTHVTVMEGSSSSRRGNGESTDSRAGRDSTTHYRSRQQPDSRADRDSATRYHSRQQAGSRADRVSATHYRSRQQPDSRADRDSATNYRSRQQADNTAYRSSAARYSRAERGAAGYQRSRQASDSRADRAANTQHHAHPQERGLQVNRNAVPAPELARLTRLTVPRSAAASPNSDHR